MSEPTWRTVIDIEASTSGGGIVDLPAGTVLWPEPIEYQTDPDWCVMRCDATDEAVFIHNDDLELIDE